MTGVRCQDSLVTSIVSRSHLWQSPPEGTVVHLFSPQARVPHWAEIELAADVTGRGDLQGG